MDTVNPTTYQIKRDDNNFELVVGDEKQKDFYPRVKIKKWNNECNLSIGLADNLSGGDTVNSNDKLDHKKDTVTARFYELPKEETQPLKSIRRAINGNRLKAIEATSEFELVKQIYHPGELYLAHYIVEEPSLASFDLMPASMHLDVDNNSMVKDFNYADKSTYHASDVPAPSYDRIKLVRFYTPYTPFVNPCYMDQGVHQFDMQWFGTDLHGVAKTFMDSIEFTLKPRGVEIKRHHERAKLYFKHKDRWVKFFSGQEDSTGLYSYINISAFYNKAFDFYRPEIEKDIRDQFAYGIQNAHPEITHEVVEEILQEFAKRLKVPLNDSSFTEDEIKKWKTVQKLQDNYEWAVNGRRSDANWFKREKRSGFEFEVIYEKKPPTNEIKLTANVPKNVISYVQSEVPRDKMYGENIDRPADVNRSLAVYHSNKKDNEYKCGKVTHIYRPIAHDSEGHSVFCDFKELAGLKDGSEYNLAKGLTIVLPQDFFDTAAYPITVDPTFGYTTVGASSMLPIFVIKGTVHTGASGTLDSISFVLKNDTATTATYEGLVYRSSDGTLVGHSANGTTILDKSWRTLSMSGESVSAQDYVLSAWTTGTGAYGGIQYFYYDSTAGKTSKSCGVGAISIDSPPDPITWAADESDRQYSIYVTYTASNIKDIIGGSGIVPFPR